MDNKYNNKQISSIIDTITNMTIIYGIDTVLNAFTLWYKTKVGKLKLLKEKAEL